MCKISRMEQQRPLRCIEVPLVRHRLLPERTILRSKRFQFLLVPAHGAAAIHRNTGPRSKCGAALTISYNRISERLESAKRLHRYLNFADDGNHARLDTSIARFVGFLCSVILRSGVTHRGGQDRVLLVFSVDLKSQILCFSFQFRSILHLFSLD